MNIREVGLLTFKALSIYALIRALEQTEWILYRWRRIPVDAGLDLWIYLDLFAPFLLLVLFSVLLWIGASRLSNKMFLAEDRIIESSSISLNEARSIAFLAIGLYLLVDTISPLVQTLFSVYASLKNVIDPESRTQVTMLRITTVLKIALALWLIFGNKGATNILKKIRNE
jgi:hypothetical protein